MGSTEIYGEWRGGGSGLGREEEEDRCAQLCSTDVESSSVSVEDERKRAGRRATPALARV